eukprot:TRINITY_DN3315_c0_g1_i1.p1 TRINITY_DN3315_c0_g1~~TRINITY_DN3315_c0_g1_i1.p1  ORF type:complete len:104 (+),score=16.85 TRINITY_DN3315_c0_g1_i1:246-557(+)
MSCPYSDRINEEESNILNSLFSQEDSFSFTGDQKICFITGSSATRRQTKYDYFRMLGIYPNPVQQLFTFSEEEMNRTGCQAAIVSWNKIRLMDRENILERCED